MIFDFMKSNSSQESYSDYLMDQYLLITEISKEHYAFNSALYIYDVILTEKEVYGGENYDILIENFIKESIAKLKEIIKRALEKIKEFFTKVINYIKNIFKKNVLDKIEKIKDIGKTVTITAHFYDFEKGFNFFNNISEKFFFTIDNRLDLLKKLNQNLEDQSVEKIQALIPHESVDEFILGLIGGFRSYDQLKEELTKKMLGDKVEQTTVQMTIDDYKKLILATRSYFESLRETEEQVIQVYNHFLKELDNFEHSNDLSGVNEEVKKIYFKYVNFLSTLTHKCSNVLTTLISQLIDFVMSFVNEATTSLKKSLHKGE